MTTVPQFPATGEATRRFLATAGRTPPPADSLAPAPAFKRYADTTRVLLPWDGEPSDSGVPLIGWVLRNLLGLVRAGWTNGPARRGGTGWDTGPSTLFFRPVASGGRCYPMEAYVAAGLPGIAPGLYHYDPAHHVLELIRDDDHRPDLLRALAPSGTAEPDTRETPELIILLSAVFWRTGRTYGDFAYRLQCQETGGLIAQFLAVAGDLGRSGRAHLLFDGPRLGRLLGLDPAAEGVMGLLSLPGPAGAGPGSCGPADGDRAVRPPTRPLHPPPPVGETLPALLRLHRAATEAADPGTDLPAARLPAASGPGVDVPVTAGAGLSAGFGRRASAPAGFALSSIGIADVAPLLGAAAEGYASDFRASARGPLMCGLYLLALRVEGLPVGGYRCAVETGRLEPVGTWPGRPALTGGLRPETALVLGEAAAVLFPVGDPSAAVPGIGDRWYRLQQTEAGIMVHRAALAAAAINLAARLHSDLCTPAVDAALGLGRTPLRTLSALAVGAPPPRTLLRWAG